jgi:hypothetical protein
MSRCALKVSCQKFRAAVVVNPFSFVVALALMRNLPSAYQAQVAAVVAVE